MEQVLLWALRAGAASLPGEPSRRRRPVRRRPWQSANDRSCDGRRCRADTFGVRRRQWTSCVGCMEENSCQIGMIAYGLACMCWLGVVSVGNYWQTPSQAKTGFLPFQLKAEFRTAMRQDIQGHWQHGRLRRMPPFRGAVRPSCAAPPAWQNALSMSGSDAV